MVYSEQELKTNKKKSFTLYSSSIHITKASLKTEIPEKMVTVVS